MGWIADHLHRNPRSAIAILSGGSVAFEGDKGHQAPAGLN
jgi:hypothetical protein